MSSKRFSTFRKDFYFICGYRHIPINSLIHITADSLVKISNSVFVNLLIKISVNVFNIGIDLFNRIISTRLIILNLSIKVIQLFTNVSFLTVSTLNITCTSIHGFRNNIQIIIKPNKVVNITVSTCSSFQLFINRSDSKLNASPEFREVTNLSPVIFIVNINANRYRLSAQISVTIDSDNNRITRILFGNIPLNRVCITNGTGFNVLLHYLNNLRYHFIVTNAIIIGNRNYRTEKFVQRIVLQT